MHRDERQHEPKNTIMEKDNKQQGQDSGCNTASCYAEQNKIMKKYKIIKTPHFPNCYKCELQGNYINSNSTELFHPSIESAIKWIKKQGAELA